MTDNLLKYIKMLKHRGLSPNTVESYMYGIKAVTDKLAKPLTGATEDELLDALDSMELKNSTERSYRFILNKYFQWLNHPVQLPPLKKEKRMTVQASDLLSPSDIDQLIQGMDHPRNKALVATTYESACRASEILGLRLKDITFTSTHTRIQVRGKTGERIIPLVWSVTYLQQYLNTRTDLDEEDQIWSSPHRGNLTPVGFYLMLSRKSKTILGRKVNPHLLRHSRLTFLTKHPAISTSVLSDFAGWVQGTPMMRTYIHLAGTDVEDAILSLHGRKRSDAKPEVLTEPAPCPRCREMNPTENRFCFKCGQPITDLSLLEPDDVERDVRTQLLQAMSGESDLTGLEQFARLILKILNKDEDV